MCSQVNLCIQFRVLLVFLRFGCAEERILIGALYRVVQDGRGRVDLGKLLRRICRARHAQFIDSLLMVALNLLPTGV